MLRVEAAEHVATETYARTLAQTRTVSPTQQTPQLPPPHTHNTHSQTGEAGGSSGTGEALSSCSAPAPLRRGQLSETLRELREGAHAGQVGGRGGGQGGGEVRIRRMVPKDVDRSLIALLRQHTSAYAYIRQQTHTSAYVPKDVDRSLIALF
jgi:hypothetical protein